MKANPGGEIAPHEVVGRDRLIESLWETLASQSVVLVAERRMGKSCVLKKMNAETPRNLLTVYRDVEGIATAVDFVERVYQDVEKHLSTLNRTAGRVSALLKKLEGVEVGGFVKFPKAAASHWKTLLEKTLEDLAEHQDRRVVLFWDELPLMLKTIAANSGERMAMEILDTLRGLRQMHARLRMVYSGSIGLHHVAAALRGAGHSNDATNDMRIIEVPQLDHRDACLLAIQLLDGERLRCQARDATARTIADAVDCIPYYIHSVIKTMKDEGDLADSKRVKRIVAGALVHDQDPWHLQHYRERLTTYYSNDVVPVVLALLDELAVAEDTVTFGQLHSNLAANLEPGTSRATQQILSGDLELLRQILTLLQRDHYVRQERGTGAYCFRFPFIGRWWRVHRNLS